MFDLKSEVKKLVHAGQKDLAAQLILRNLNPEEDFTSHLTKWNLLKRNPPEAKLQKVKLAIVSTSTANHLVDFLKMYFYRAGFEAEIFLTEFRTVEQSVLNATSSLYEFNPDILWLDNNFQDLQFPSNDEKAAIRLGDNLSRWSALWESIQKNSSAYIIQNNIAAPFTRSFGSLDSIESQGRLNFVRSFNQLLASKAIKGVTLFDMEYLSSLVGKKHWFAERYWYHSKHAFNLEYVGIVSSQLVQLVTAIKGKSKKCLVLDLDNTLWGGVIGDDGVQGIKLGNGAHGEAFVDFQRYILELKNRGVILAVCSKNDEANAQSPFLTHPDMQIKLEDISCFVANWNNKADNIRHIAATLDIGLDSFVFVDDNPVERNIVRTMLPEVAVPEMTEDPADYIRILEFQNYFDMISFSDEDRDRSSMYRSNVERKELSQKFTDISDFLIDLNMKSTVGNLDNFYLQRITQLINKSNQFNLTTKRYTEAEMLKVMEDNQYQCRYYKLVDKFGDNGLISVVILKDSGECGLEIDTWVMSCRVLSRGMEDFVLDDLVAVAKARKAKKLIGHYIPTAKNKLVEKHYSQLGFKLFNEDQGTTQWQLELDTLTESKNKFILRESAT